MDPAVSGRTETERGLNAPPLLLAAVLAFWGWQTGYLAVGLVLGPALEASRLIRRRIEFTDKDFHRLTDLCAVIFAALFFYRLIAGAGSSARWLPPAFFPLVAAQVYSTRGAVPLSALFWTFRRRRGSRPAGESPAVSLVWPYFAACFMAASAANVRNPWFYLGLLFLTGWALFHFRPQARSKVTWAALLLLAGAAGWAGQIYLHRLHLWVQQKGVDWFVSTGEHDPYRNSTALGELGQLKLSDRILFRVGAGSAGRESFLLREASYNIYRRGRWVAAGTRFTALRPERDGADWNLAPPADRPRDLTVFSPLSSGKGLLRLPLGAFRVERLPADRVERNQYGAVKVSEGPGLVSYRVLYAPGTGLDAPPGEADLAVPEEEAPALARAVESLSLSGRSDEEKLAAVQDYFRRNFTYALDTGTSLTNKSPLAAFLLDSRRGHCEYFAAAATLLLRRVGVPARYVVGYMVHDYSPTQGVYLVRARHAHAWTLAFVGGAWRELDATPPAWIRLETEAAPFWEPLYDLWSWAGFKLSQWRWGGGLGGAARRLWWLVAILVVILGRRLFIRKRLTEKKEARVEEKAGFTGPGADSAAYRLERRLAELGFVRADGETLAALADRIESSAVPGLTAASLRPIIGLHYRLRFDPRGLADQERRRLDQNVREWLKDHQA
ncbi:MAG: transglutaminase domain-containing protein [Thermodesulfobacteriota bacterium]